MTSSGWPITRPTQMARVHLRRNQTRARGGGWRDFQEPVREMPRIWRRSTHANRAYQANRDASGRGGTDPTAALRIACPIPDIGGLAVPPKSYSVEDSQLLKDCAGVKAGEAFSGNPFAKTVQVAVDSIKQKAYAAAGIDASEQRAMEDLDRRGGVAWRDTLIDTRRPYGPYAARPLYWHLGSGALPA